MNCLIETLTVRLCCSILAKLCFTDYLLSHTLTRCIIYLSTTVYFNILPSIIKIKIPQILTADVEAIARQHWVYII